MAMTTTDWREMKRGTHVVRTRIKYGFDAPGGSQPHFAMTHESERHPARGGRWTPWTYGIANEADLWSFPELRPLRRWHLVGVRKGPLHYVANGVYWWEIAVGEKTNTSGGPEPLGAFSHTIVLGALPGELPVARYDDGGVRVSKTVVLRDKDEVRAFLEKRLPRLLRTMRADMRAAGVAVPRA